MLHRLKLAPVWSLSGVRPSAVATALAVALAGVSGSALGQSPPPAPIQAPAAGTAEGDKYLTKLIDAVTSNEEFKVRLQAAVLLGRSSEERAVPPLINALTNDAHYTVRAAAATALANLDELKAISHILKAAAADPDAFVREEAQRAVRKYDPEEALPFVMATYNGSDDPLVRKEAVRLIVEDDLQQAAEPVLERALGDVAPIFELAKSAVQKLDAEHAIRLLQASIDHREPSVRRGAVQVLHAVGTPEATRLILSVYERDIEVDEVRTATREALRSLRAQLPMEQIVKDATQNPERYARARAIKLLGVIGGEQAEKVLVAALGDEEIYIRGNAVMAMQWLGSSKVVPELEKLGTDPANQRIMLQIRTVLKALREKNAEVHN